MNARFFAAQLALFACLFALSACSLPLDRVEAYEVEQPIELLRVTNSSGDIEVVATDRATIAVRAEIYGEEAQVEQAIEGATLTLGVDAPGSCWGCEIDFFIEVPAGVAVDLENGSGTVRLAGMVGSTDVIAGSGDIHLSDLGGLDVRLETGSGDIDAHRLRAAEVRALTGSGSIHLRFDAYPSRLFTQSGSGSQAIAVPAGLYDVDWSTGSGDFTAVGLTFDPNAAPKLRFESGSGDIRVRGF